MSAHGRDAVRASAAIPKLVATAERNKAASDVQNQAGLALFYIIDADHQQPEEPDPTWRQVAASQVERRRLWQMARGEAVMCHLGQGSLRRCECCDVTTSEHVGATNTH